MSTEILLELVLILLVLYLIFFKSYFTEKGKNLATSEDIEELTAKVESVKQQFIEKNAVLKAKLDLLTNLQINHKNDERLSVIEFHKKLKKWIGLLTESIPVLKDDYDDDEIRNKMHVYEMVYQEMLGAKAVLELYVEDKKLIDLVQKLHLNTIETLGTNPKLYLIELGLNNHYIRQLETESDKDKKNEKHKELLEKRLSMQKEYIDKMIKALKENLLFEMEYLDYAKKYLKKISNEEIDEETDDRKKE